MEETQTQPAQAQQSAAPTAPQAPETPQKPEYKPPQASDFGGNNKFTKRDLEALGLKPKEPVQQNEPVKQPAEKQNDEQKHTETESHQSETVNQPKEKLQEANDQHQEDPRLAARFAALAREEAKLREERGRLKQESEEVRRYKEARERAKENPDEWLELADLNYDYLTKYKLNDSKPLAEETNKKLEERLNRLEEEKKQLQEQTETQNLQRQQQEAIRTIKSIASQNSDKWELVNTLDKAEEVYDVIRLHYNNTGKVMSPQEALDLTEKYYEDQYANTVKQSKKLKKYFSPTQEEQQSSTDSGSSPITQQDVGEYAKDPKTAQRSNKTLSNHAVGYHPPQIKEGQAITDRERIANAAKLLRWNT